MHDVYVKIHVVLFLLISLANYVFTESGALPYRACGWIGIPCHYRSYYCPQLNIFMHLKKVRRSTEDRRFIYIFYRDFHNSCIFERPKIIEAGIHMGILSFYFQGIKSSCFIVQWLKMKMIKFIKLHYILTVIDVYRKCKHKRIQALSDLALGWGNLNTVLVLHRIGIVFSCKKFPLFLEEVSPPKWYLNYYSSNDRKIFSANLPIF